MERASAIKIHTLTMDCAPAIMASVLWLTVSLPKYAAATVTPKNTAAISVIYHWYLIMPKNRMPIPAANEANTSLCARVRRKESSTTNYLQFGAFFQIHFIG